MGKPVDSDIREGKRNLLFARAASDLSGEERDFLIDRWGGGESLTVDEVQRLRLLVERSGARASVERLTYELADEARAIVRAAPIPAEAAAALLALADLAVNRLT
jgi:geranylgeranyl diphosphate synthase type I